MNIELKKLSKEALLKAVRAQAKNEQSLILDVIALIREVDVRRLFLELGFGSLFDFVTLDLGYEATSAHRRISAARLITAVPETEQKMRSGELSLSVASRAQTFFRQKEKRTGERVSKEEKVEVLKQLENTSSREAEKIFVSRSPENIKYFEMERELSEEFTELKLVIDKELKTDLDELKSLLAHQSPKLTYLELIRLMVKKTRRTLGFKTSNKVVLNQEASVGNPISQDICAVAEDWTKSDVASETLKHSRYINSQIKRQIWLRDNGCCQFVGKKTGRKCNSRYFIEIDHIHRFADGGSSDISNLRLICRNHNQFRG